ncbi:hypothetical protein ATN89_17510 [Comamonas thiooxydans]|uniref:hypothetical protein n=1 Tax=Comamonas thiooxydans TaxID=363952 RepID=UPI0007C56D1A|nr:hypothetical protein [Comamonas thiooxydans]OAD82880.1 hypothetical protein ATN89_17510 [Comamonas thiooxydans]
MTDTLTSLIDRRHPLYNENLPHWNFLEATYEGGRAWFKDNIFRYLKEGDEEYAGRVKRAYRFNHTRQVVDLIDKYLFKQPIHRSEDAPEEIAAFWKNATLSGLNMDNFSRRISNSTSKFGRVWVVVDSTLTAQDDEAVSKADEKKQGARVYAYIVKPQDALDMSYDEMGRLNWILFREMVRDDADPLNATGKYLERFRLWTRDSWFLIGEERYGRHLRRSRYAMLAQGKHDLGVVPVVQADHVLSEELYETQGLIDDIAYLDRANANYLSNLDAIIQDQTFSQLTMPAQGLMPGDDMHQKLVEAGTKRIFTYNGEAGQKPEFISPDPRQASMILAAVGKIINEIYHSVGLSAERTKDDNGGGVDNSSGVAKAYDFERVNSLLAAKSASLEQTEIRILALVMLWKGQETVPADVAELLAYPKKFDTRSLYDEFEIGARLSLLAAPDEVRRKQMLQVVEKLFPAMSKSDRKVIEAAIKKWPPDPIEQAQKMAKATGSLPGTEKGGDSNANKGGDPVRAAATQKTAKEMVAS